MPDWWNWQTRQSQELVRKSGSLSLSSGTTFLQSLTAIFRNCFVNCNPLGDQYMPPQSNWIKHLATNQTLWVQVLLGVPSSPISSGEQSIGLLNRVSLVRIQYGIPYAVVVQMVERYVANVKVTGSRPVYCSIKLNKSEENKNWEVVGRHHSRRQLLSPNIEINFFSALFEALFNSCKLPQLRIVEPKLLLSV